MYRYLVATMLLICGATAHAEALKICVEANNWRPFTYVEQEQVKGIHIDVISDTLDSLNYQYQYHPVPWKRCLKGLEKGFYDAVATASYNKKRNLFLHYPEGNEPHERSYWRVTQVEYVIATPQEKDFTFEEDYQAIPKPIRIPRGYSIAQDLKNMDVTVDDSALNDLQNIKRMLRENSGSVIAVPSVIDWYNERFEPKIQYDKTPLISKSYYFSISKRGKISKTNAKTIWDTIAANRAKVLEKISQSMAQEEMP